MARKNTHSKKSVSRSLKLESLEPRLLMAADLSHALDSTLDQYNSTAEWHAVSSVSGFVESQAGHFSQSLEGLGVSLQDLLLRAESTVQSGQESLESFSN